MKTDKELLELAAKAAGYNVKSHEDGTLYSDYKCAGYCGVWKPLTDDGDAFRLAVSLQIDFYVDGKQAGAWVDDFVCLVEDIGLDTYAATRRAIVRAAAAIGEWL